MIDMVMQHLMVVWVVVLTLVEHLMEILRQPFQMSLKIYLVTSWVEEIQDQEIHKEQIAVQI